MGKMEERQARRIAACRMEKLELIDSIVDILNEHDYATARLVYVFVSSMAEAKRKKKTAPGCNPEAVNQMVD